MAIYTVHQPPAKGDEAAPDPERFVFVRDGFAFWAFLLAPLWMLRHRLWLAFIGYVLVTIALQVGLRLIGASATVLLAVGALVSLLIGFEAATLRRFTLSRRRWRSVGIVVGDDFEAAERRFFDAWFKDARLGDRVDSAPRVASVPALVLPAMRRPSPEVIGLFPEPGAPR
jgi:Protein of unknown function (DUF2628)